MDDLTTRSRSRSGYDVGRVRGFSDCVFAVAITITVLTFVTPAQALSDRELLDFVADEWPRFLAYVAAFVVIGIMWLTHHRLFEVIVRVDAAAAWLNLALLAFVVLIPFPMQLLGLYRELPSAYLLFYVSAMVLGALGFALVAYATAGRRLVSPRLSTQVIRAYRWRAAVLPLAFLLAALGSLIGPPGSVVGWAALVFGWIVVRRLTGAVAEADTEVVDDDEMVESHTIAQQESGRISRLAGFSDNVYAFAITLIVLQLRLPDPPVHTDAEFRSFVAAALHPDLAGYAIGFAVIGLLWNFHHRDFLLIQREDGTLRVLNLIHLMFVAAMPFATLVLSSYSWYSSSTIVFAVLALGASGSLAVEFRYATTDHRLIDPDFPATELRVRRRLTWVAPTAFAVSIPVAVVSPAAAQVLWCLSLAGFGLVRRRAIEGSIASAAGSAQPTTTSAETTMKPSTVTNPTSRPPLP